MTRIEELLAEAVKRSCQAIILSSMRQVHLLIDGGLRPFSNRALSTKEIVDMVAEVAPAGVRRDLARDGELAFSFNSPAGPVEVKIEKKAEFIYARIDSPKPAPAPAKAKAAPAAAAAAQEAKPPRASPFEGLDLDLGNMFSDAALRRAAEPKPAAPVKGSFPKPFGSEVKLELGTFVSKAPDPAALAEAAAAMGTARDFEMDDGGDEPLELEQTAPAAAPRMPTPLPGSASLRKSLTPTGGKSVARSAKGPGIGVMLPSLLQALVGNGGSDLHLAVGSSPRIRLRGELVPMGEVPLTPAETQTMFEFVLDNDQRERWQKEQALDFSVDMPGVGRFRANAYRQRKGIDLVFRAIAPKIPTLADLGLPAAAEKLTTYPNGLILVTGPAGCGKSTTQAALIDRINETWHDHVITVEDPIEFIHPVKSCLVNQREVGTHVRTFAEALRSALREDPDVILVGELRDLETIQLAITAAETGHLVLGTLHTIDSARTIDRLVDVFPGEQKLQMRSMVSESLRGIISQKLLPTADGEGRVAAFELLLADRSVANLIREGKTFQIPNVLKTGKAKGMVAMDDAIIALVRAKKVTVEVALQNMERPEELVRLIKPAPKKPAPQGAGQGSVQGKGAAAQGRKS